MTSRFINQIFNQNSTEASIYETIASHDAADPQDVNLNDLEERAGLQHHHPHPTEDDDDLYEPGLSNRRRDSNLDSSHGPARRFFPALSGPSQRRPPAYTDDDDHVDVPESLLFEHGEMEAGTSRRSSRDMPKARGSNDTERGGDPRARRLSEQWNAAIAPAFEPPASPIRRPNLRGPINVISPKDRALWKWANVENLDSFLQDVYLYFQGKGIYCILLSRVLNLMTLAFVVGFTTFLTLCIDFGKLKSGDHMNNLDDIMIPHCMSGMSRSATFFLWCITFFWMYKLITYILDVKRLIDMYHFFTHLLEIPDSDMQTVSWQEIIARLMVLRDANPNTADNLRRRDYSGQSKQRMDAHDIANRLMRRENYLIAMFNKDVLDLTIPLPYFRNRGGMLTRTLEWNLSQCILDFVFTEQGQFRTLFLKDTHRKALSEGLRRRFIFAGTMNLILTPFIVPYVLLLFVFENLHDYIKTPAKIGRRRYTPLAEWKFREFNELWHLFKVRIDMSYPAAESYVDQFPKHKTAEFARFVSFVASSLLAVLVVGSIIDYELLMVFQLRDGLNALACMTALTTIYAIARGMIPEENTVYDPEWSICQVIQHTHYMPDHWKDNLHSDKVKLDFLSLYKLKMTIFVEELLSVILTPFVLWVSLPKCSDRIIDFFREFTVHVDGVGYVCSFAVFNFQKPGQQKVEDLRGEYFASKDNKMIASYIGFMDQYHNPQNRPLGREPRRNHVNQMQPDRGHPFSPALTMHMSTHRRPDFPNQHGFNPNPGLVRGAGVGASMYREGPRGGPGGGGMGASMMMRSSLLDYHHQPVGRTPRMTGFQDSVFREEDEEDNTDRGRPGHSEGNLGESFDSVIEHSRMHEEEESEGEDAGVLGLLNQFMGHHTPGVAAAAATGRTGVI